MDEKLIKLVRGYDCLYNMSSRHYLNTQMKKNAWDKIGREMNKTGEECQKRWSNVRNNYNKALKNRKAKCADPDAKRRPIKHEKELEFLKNFMQDRKKRTNFDSPSDDTQNLFVDVNEEHHSATRGDPTTSAEQSGIEQTKQMDPIDLFFQTMASTTKKLPEYVQVQIKRQIFNIVNDAEFNYVEGNEVRLVSTPTLGQMSEEVSSDLRHIPPYHANHSTASPSGSGYGTASTTEYKFTPKSSFKPEPDSEVETD